MYTRLVNGTAVGFIYLVLNLYLTGCGAIVKTYPTEVRNIPLEVEAKLSLGDSRQDVRSVLGNPLIYEKSHRIEVYQHAGRDINFVLPNIPIPVPELGEKVIVITMVAYDDQGLVKEIATRSWSPDRGHIYYITAGGYSYVNAGKHFGHSERSPDTLLGKATTWESLAGLATTEKECVLILLMGECPMEEVILDNSRIIDLSPAGGYCDSDTAGVRNDSNFYYGNSYYGTYVRKNIIPGNHSLSINQKTKHGNFETTFSCESTETIYAELHVHTVDDWWHGSRLEGEVSATKSMPHSVIEMGYLRPILWHRGAWYTESDMPP